MYLIATNVISRTSPIAAEDAGVPLFLDRHYRQSYISVVTLGELWFGAERLRLRGADRKASLVASWIEEVETSYAERLLGVDVAIGRVTGEVLARAEAAGHDPGHEDACLAATAAVHGFTVVTFNARHFQALGVPYRSPTADGMP